MGSLELSSHRIRVAPPLVGMATVALTCAILVRPVLTVLALVGIGLFVAVMVHPPLAAYALLGSTPLIVGIDRAALVPVLRPNEALLVLLGAALVARGLVRVWSGARPRGRLTRLDGALLLMVLTSSLLPLLWMVARRKAITSDDFLYSLTLLKYYAVFLVVRTAVSTELHLRRCLQVAMAAAAVVAVIAVLQSLKLFGVPSLLANYYAPFSTTASLDINRGTSTLASSIATGDVMAFNLAIALMWLARGGRPTRLLQAAAGLFIFGGLASGQFSAVIALVTVVVAVGALTSSLTRKLVGLIASGCVAAVVLQPVLARRLDTLSSTSGLPQGWVDRLTNLREFFWPPLFSDYNWILGVRPSPRIATPLFRTGYVWIESGHTWLLWSGGVPFVAAFLVFVWIALRVAHATARRPDAVGVAAGAAFAALLAMFILMTFDPHLTLRGSADLLFALLGLMTARIGTRLPVDELPPVEAVAAYG